MNTVVVVNTLGMKWFPGHIGFGKLGPKPGGFDQFGGGNVIGMRIDPIRCKQPIWPRTSNYTGEFFTGVDCRLQAAIVLDEMGEQARPAEQALKKALKGQPNKYITRVANRALNVMNGTNNVVK